MRTRAVATALLVAMLLAGVQPAAALPHGAACDAVLPGEANETAGPGGYLSDAIGAQGAALAAELDYRRFDARLANATSDRERAAIVAAERDRVRERVRAVERCWRNHQGGEADEAAELPPRRVAELHRQSVTLHWRVNETANRAASLPPERRAAHGIDDESFATLERRVVDLRTELNRSAPAAPPRVG